MAEAVAVWGEEGEGLAEAWKPFERCSRRAVSEAVVVGGVGGVAAVVVLVAAWRRGWGDTERAGPGEVGSCSRASGTGPPGLGRRAMFGARTESGRFDPKKNVATVFQWRCR